MKLSIVKIASFTVMVFISTACFSQNKGISFFEGSWDEMMATAKKTGKPVFVDVYTTWCGPCKLMAKNIFPLEEVGIKYNASFINYKLDAEAGEGVAIALKYKVNSYPTYLYIKDDGELAYKGGGYNPDPGLFINEADKALQAVADPYTVNKMSDDFKNGKRDTTFLRTYTAKLTQLEMDNTEVLDAYFKLLSKKEKMQSSTLQFLIQNVSNVSSETFAHVMKNRKNIPASDSGDEYRNDEMGHKLANLLQRDIMKSMTSGDTEKAWKGIQYAEQLDNLDPFYKDFFSEQQLAYFDKTNKVPQLIKATHEFLKDVSALTVEQVKEENNKRYNSFMKPFLTGKADTTKDESFDKMREYVQKQYVYTVASKYYFGALHYNNKVKDKAELKKALAWSQKAYALVPENEPYKKLKEDLANKLGAK